MTWTCRRPNVSGQSIHNFEGGRYSIGKNHLPPSSHKWFLVRHNKWHSQRIYVYTDTRARHSYGLVDAHVYIAYYISRTIHITSSSLSFSSSYCSFYSSICVCPCVRECLCVYCFQNDTREGGQAETALKDDS